MLVAPIINDFPPIWLEVLLGAMIFPLYLFVAVNYFYLDEVKRKRVLWFTAIFIFFTIIYITSILLGILLFLSWHPK